MSSSGVAYAEGKLISNVSFLFIEIEFTVYGYRFLHFPVSNSIILGNFTCLLRSHPARTRNAGVEKKGLHHPTHNGYLKDEMGMW